MADNKIDIWVYADWLGMTAPKCIGMLAMQYGQGKRNCISVTLFVETNSTCFSTCCFSLKEKTLITY